MRARAFGGVGLATVLAARHVGSMSPRLGRLFSLEREEFGELDRIPQAAWRSLAEAARRVPWQNLPRTVLRLFEGDADSYEVQVYDRRALALELEGQDLPVLANEISGRIVPPGHLQLLLVLEGRVVRTTCRAAALAKLGDLP